MQETGWSAIETHDIIAEKGGKQWNHGSNEVMMSDEWSGMGA
jgi:hypothetical protein